MPEAVAAVGTAYDLSSVHEVHVGCDGEPWCAKVGEWFPGARAAAHLDPFHVNRAILSCFPDPKLGWSVAEAVWDGGKQAAACLVEVAAAQGLARPEPAARVAASLRNNADRIDVGGALAGHDGVGEPARLRREDGLLPLRVVGEGRVGHGQAALPGVLRQGRAARHEGGVGHGALAQGARRARAGGPGAAVALQCGKVRGQGLGAAPRQRRCARLGRALRGLH